MDDRGFPQNFLLKNYLRNTKKSSYSADKFSSTFHWVSPAKNQHEEGTG